MVSMVTVKVVFDLLPWQASIRADPKYSVTQTQNITIN